MRCRAIAFLCAPAIVCLHWVCVCLRSYHSSVCAAHFSHFLNSRDPFLPFTGSVLIRQLAERCNNSATDKTIERKWEKLRRREPRATNCFLRAHTVQSGQWLNFIVSILHSGAPSLAPDHTRSMCSSFRTLCTQCIYRHSQSQCIHCFPMRNFLRARIVIVVKLNLQSATINAVPVVFYPCGCGCAFYVKLWIMWNGLQLQVSLLPPTPTIPRFTIEAEKA